MMNDIGISQELAIILVIDLAIAMLLLTLMRYIQGWWGRVNTTHELAEKDNFAFGISTAGAVLALAIVLTGAITGEAAESYLMEAIGMTAYGGFGLILIKLGRWLHDKVALNQIDKPTLIVEGNMAVAVVDASVAIATAIIIRANLLWAEGLSINTFIAIFSGFLVAQFMLLVMTRLREYLYQRRNPNGGLQVALAQGQLAIAIRHGGYLVALALTFKSASYFIVFDEFAYLTNIVGWLIYSVVMLFVLSILLMIAKRLVLANVNLTREVDQQQNVGVATIEMCISIGIALILTSLMA
ncbi:DUF350 domain-containing protein [Paraferrimonas sedimenticola]|uniref:ATP synthase F0 subunit A n=1 Tax=Paraferrimonas sedimenticola TaxID=375674 RepID=A0AA37RVI3_9GAMM|nr:DUF350 domain-containing protein [Paraferrimonas sedimenticola]GLP95672.1 ATP synthase F0 subunit A [Paraferrimonas sedimenticola]